MGKAGGKAREEEAALWRGGASDTGGLSSMLSIVALTAVVVAMATVSLLPRGTAAAPPAGPPVVRSAPVEVRSELLANAPGKWECARPVAPLLPALTFLPPRVNRQV